MTKSMLFWILMLLWLILGLYLHWDVIHAGAYGLVGVNLLLFILLGLLGWRVFGSPVRD